MPESVAGTDARSSTMNELVNGLDLDQSSEDQLIQTLVELVGDLVINSYGAMLNAL